MKGRACFLSEAVMRSSMLGKKYGNKERSFRQDLDFVRTDAACDHIIFNKRTTGDSAFLCIWERVGNWIGLGLVDFTNFFPPPQHFARSGSEFDVVEGQRSFQALLKVCFS